MPNSPLHPLRPDAAPPSIETDQLVDLLDAEIILDQVRDTPHMHVDEALAIGVSARHAGVDASEMMRVNLRRSTTD